MSKKHFIGLADMIRRHNSNPNNERFTDEQIYALAGFCSDYNAMFNRSRWLDYITEKCGPNGGAIKQAQAA